MSVFSRDLSYAEMMEIDLDQLGRMLAPAYALGISSWTTEELRKRRQETEDFESAISYARRIVQGRIDIYSAGLDVEGSNSVPDAVSNLEHVLAGHASSPSARIAYIDVSASVPSAAEVSALAGVDIEALAPNEEGVGELLEQFRAGELRLSGYRRELHRLIDNLRSEIVRRYQEGNLDVDEILSSDLEQRNSI